MNKGYITPMDIAAYKLKVGADQNKTAYLWDLVQDHVRSIERRKMQEGMSYFNIVHTNIENKQRIYYVEGRKEEAKNSANNRIANPFHRVLVEQKAAYIAGNPVVISVATPEEASDSMAKKAKEFQSKLMDILGTDFDDELNNWIEEVSNQGQTWIHIYITKGEDNENGEFKYVLVPGTEVIPEYDSANQNELLRIYRYYTITYSETSSKDVRTLYKLEVWDKNQVTYYTQDPAGKKEFILDSEKQPNPQPHFKEFWPEREATDGSWGKIPFIRLQNNSKMTTDLEPIKKLIDAYDTVYSGWADDIEDFQEQIYVIKNYVGITSEAQKGMSELAVVMQNLRVHKAIAVDERGGIEVLKAEIPIEAKTKFLELTRNAIFYFGEGVDVDSDKFGNSPSGISLKFLYSSLDFKANRLIRKLQSALTVFSYFIIKYMEVIGEKTTFTAKDILFTMNKSVIFNEKEKIDAVKASDGIISRRTQLENHPYVSDVDEEEKRLEKEEQDRIDKGVVNLDLFGNQMDPNNSSNSNNADQNQ